MFNTSVVKRAVISREFSMMLQRRSSIFFLSSLTLSVSVCWLKSTALNEEYVP